MSCEMQVGPAVSSWLLIIIDVIFDTHAASHPFQCYNLWWIMLYRAMSSIVSLVSLKDANGFSTLSRLTRAHNFYLTHSNYALQKANTKCKKRPVPYMTNVTDDHYQNQ